MRNSNQHPRRNLDNSPRRPGQPRLWLAQHQAWRMPFATCQCASCSYDPLSLRQRWAFFFLFFPFFVIKSEMSELCQATWCEELLCCKTHYAI